MTPSASEGRAGRYVRQLSGYRAFMPAPLPPVPAIRLEGDLQALLSQADRALGRLDGSIQTLPHPDLFVAMYVRKEAVLSSQFVTHGVLHEMTSQRRNRRFIYRHYIDLFHDEARDVATP